MHKTSNNAISEQVDLVSEEDTKKLMPSLRIKNGKLKSQLIHAYTAKFREWFCRLRRGFNLLLHGIGSKKRLIHLFAAQHLLDGPVYVVNGYFPGLSVKHILNELTTDILHHEGTFASANAQLKFIRKVLESPDSRIKHLYILIHNIDGVTLRTPTAQAQLARLANIASVHLVASTDQLNAKLLIDQKTSALYNFIHLHTPTYATYQAEICYEGEIAGGRSVESRARGIRFVLQSLTPNHKDILIVLATHQLEMAEGVGGGAKDRRDDADEEADAEGGAGLSEGMREKEFLEECIDNMLVTSDVTFRGHLQEMIDHGLVKKKRDSSGRELCFIPYSSAVIQQEILGNE